MNKKHLPNENTYDRRLVHLRNDPPRQLLVQDSRNFYTELKMLLT